MNPEVIECVRNTLTAFEPELQFEPVLLIFNRFRNFELDLKFKNTDSVSDSLKNHVLGYFKQIRDSKEKGYQNSRTKRINFLFQIRKSSIQCR